MKKQRGKHYFATLRILTFLGVILAIFGSGFLFEWLVRLLFDRSFRLPLFFWFSGLSVAAIFSFLPILPPKSSRFSVSITTEKTISEIRGKITNPNSYFPISHRKHENPEIINNNSVVEIEIDNNIFRRVHIKDEKNLVLAHIEDRIEPSSKDRDISIYGRIPEVRLRLEIKTEEISGHSKIKVNCTMFEYNLLLKMLSIFRNNERALIKYVENILSRP